MRGSYIAKKKKIKITLKLETEMERPFIKKWLLKSVFVGNKKEFILEVLSKYHSTEAEQTTDGDEPRVHTLFKQAVMSCESPN